MWGFKLLWSPLKFWSSLLCSPLSIFIACRRKVSIQAQISIMSIYVRWGTEEKVVNLNSAPLFLVLSEEKMCHISGPPLKRHDSNGKGYISTYWTGHKKLLRKFGTLRKNSYQTSWSSIYSRFCFLLLVNVNCGIADFKHTLLCYKHNRPHARLSRGQDLQRRSLLCFLEVTTHAGGGKT